MSGWSLSGATETITAMNRSAPASSSSFETRASARANAWRTALHAPKSHKPMTRNARTGVVNRPSDVMTAMRNETEILPFSRANMSACPRQKPSLPPNVAKQ